MSTFQYYKRGAGELDTSNFPELLANGYIEIQNLDEKTFMSLLTFNYWLDTVPSEKYDNTSFFLVKIYGYVAHLRSDKDLFSPAKLYDLFTNLMFKVYNIQHESVPMIKSAQIGQEKILMAFPQLCPWFTTFVGADSSVHKFFPDVEYEAEKIRKDGKVISTELKIEWPSAIRRVIIVDDLLGGGATVQMLVDTIREQGYEGEVYLWTAYNEGFHTDAFLSQFNGYYVGEEV
jgi:hypothetical protein